MSSSNGGGGEPPPGVSATFAVGRAATLSATRRQFGTEETTAVLIAKARDGNASAWEQIVNRYARLVVHIANSFFLEREEVRDVAQIVWLRLVEQLATLRDPDALASWLGTTTRNECIRRERLRRRPPIERKLIDLTTAPLPEDVAIEKLDRELVRHAFARLDDRCRQLLSVLFADVDGGYAAISATLGMPVGSIGPTRARCLEHLKRMLAETSPS